MPSEAYRKWVYRLWDRLKDRTGHPPHYMARGRLASYCPCCLTGTVGIQLLQHPRPGAAFASSATGSVGCSNGCTEPEIVEALFG